MPTTLWVVLLLVGSNAFMTAAWYGHLKYPAARWYWVILVSWLIALPEYALQVPANRLGYGRLSATQLKVIQEVVSLSVFAVFAFFYLGEAPTWRTGLAFLLIVAAVALVRGEGGKAVPAAEHPPPAGVEAGPRG
ncbi:MAG: DMT family protein [Gemmataceae bacterium]|nr:DMT family protein [Gemmataceae bacterium]